MKTYLSILIVIISFGTWACNNEGNTRSNTASKIINPNGDSELALLMRAMFDDGMDMKTAIEKGQHPSTKVDYAKIFTATATEPDKAASPEFKAFADVYLEQMKALENCTTEEAAPIFKTMVTSCMNCHAAMCPGPMVRIKKLY